MDVRARPDLRFAYGCALTTITCSLTLLSLRLLPGYTTGSGPLPAQSGMSFGNRRAIDAAAEQTCDHPRPVRCRSSGPRWCDNRYSQPARSMLETDVRRVPSEACDTEG